MYRSLLGDQAWEQLPPAKQAQRRAEGAAFQVDMASELKAPFNFADVLVPALVDPVEQVAPVWHHWHKPSIHSYPGGHIGYAVRRDVRWFVDAAFIRSGVFHLGTVRVGAECGRRVVRNAGALREFLVVIGSGRRKHVRRP